MASESNIPSDHSATRPELTWLDRILAFPMFLVALAILIVAGFLLPTMLYRESKANSKADIEIKLNQQSTSQFSTDLIDSQLASELSEEIVYFKHEMRLSLMICLIALWGIVALEAILHKLSGANKMKQHILFLLFPFMRLSCRDHVDGSHAWVIGLGWRKTSLIMERTLSDAFSIPMVVIALPILPLIVVQFFWSDAVNSNQDLKFAMATATAVIWMAFVFEFAIMFTVAKRKMKYCKQNWINVFIVVLPLFGFLKIAAFGSLIKVKQLAKTVSVLRLRGLAVRFWRAMISLGLIDKAMRKTADHKIDKLDKLIEEKNEELELLRWEQEKLRTKSQRGMESPSENPAKPEEQR